MNDRIYRDSSNFTAEQHEAVDRMKSDERKPNLLDFATVYRQCAEVIADHGGDLDHPEVHAALGLMTTAEDSIHHKIDAIREVIADFERMAAARKEEGELRIERSKALMKAVDRLEQWAILGIERAGLQRAGTIIPMAVCNNGGKEGIFWDRPHDPIPEEFRVVKVEFRIDREKVEEYRKANGRLPDGFGAMGRGKHLRPVLGESSRRKKGAD